MRFSLPLNLLLLGLSLPSVAQTHFCIAGDLDHLSQTEVAACKAKMSDVREAVRRRGAPAGWRFVMVCDETGWSDLAGFSGREAARIRKADFNTETDLHWTFLRGSHMDSLSGAAATMLHAALKNVPGRVEAGPQPMPNPERKVQQPVFEIAESREPSPEITIGQ